MLRDAGKGFLALGLVCMTLGIMAMTGGVLAGSVVLRWGLPLLLVAVGVLGLTRHRRRPT